MKKIIMILMIVSIAGFLAAELEVNVPFEMDIVGDSYAEKGEYEYVSEWIELTNTSGNSLEYTIQYDDINTPEGWHLVVCNEISCYPSMQYYENPLPFSLKAGETLKIHITVNVKSTNGFAFPIILAGGDLAEPKTLNFTFKTADYVNNSALEVNIPFEMNIEGDSYAEVGEYHYESEWIELTNTSGDSLEYTIQYDDINTPEDWHLGVCDETCCYPPARPVPFSLKAGETLKIHITVDVKSTNKFAFPIILAGGDLAEPKTLNFTFKTADYVNNSADENLIISENINNYPNPFNPETTISFSIDKKIVNGKVEIYNSKGQQVDKLAINSNNVIWKADQQASGIYFYRLVSDNFNSEMKKMTLIK